MSNERTIENIDPCTSENQVKGSGIPFDPDLKKACEELECHLSRESTVEEICNAINNIEKQIIFSDKDIVCDQVISVLSLILDACISLPLFAVVKEACKFFNQWLANNFIRDLMASEKSLQKMLMEFGQGIYQLGDFESQACLLETLVRVGGDMDQRFWAENWFYKQDTIDLFLKIDPSKFDCDCRTFLNSINKSEIGRTVWSVIACSIEFCKFELKEPSGIEMWVDFNYISRSISFYCSELTSNSESEKPWESVTINSDIVQSCSLTYDSSCEKQEVNITVLKSFSECFASRVYSFENEYNEIQMVFWYHLNIHKHLQVIFGDLYKGITATYDPIESDTSDPSSSKDKRRAVYSVVNFSPQVDSPLSVDDNDLAPTENQANDDPPSELPKVQQSRQEVFQNLSLDTMAVSPLIMPDKKQSMLDRKWSGSSKSQDPIEISKPNEKRVNSGSPIDMTLNLDSVDSINQDVNEAIPCDNSQDISFSKKKISLTENAKKPSLDSSQLREETILPNLDKSQPTLTQFLKRSRKTSKTIVTSPVSAKKNDLIPDKSDTDPAATKTNAKNMEKRNECSISNNITLSEEIEGVINLTKKLSTEDNEDLSTSGAFKEKSPPSLSTLVNTKPTKKVVKKKSFYVEKDSMFDISLTPEKSKDTSFGVKGQRLSRGKKKNATTVTPSSDSGLPVSDIIAFTGEPGNLFTESTEGAETPEEVNTYSQGIKEATSSSKKNSETTPDTGYVTKTFKKATYVSLEKRISISPDSDFQGTQAMRHGRKSAFVSMKKTRLMLSSKKGNYSSDVNTSWDKNWEPSPFNFSDSDSLGNNDRSTVLPSSDQDKSEKVMFSTPLKTYTRKKSLPPKYTPKPTQQKETKKSKKTKENTPVKKDIVTLVPSDMSCVNKFSIAVEDNPCTSSHHAKKKTYTPKTPKGQTSKNKQARKGSYGARKTTSKEPKESQVFQDESLESFPDIDFDSLTDPGQSAVASPPLLMSDGSSSPFLIRKQHRPKDKNIRRQVTKIGSSMSRLPKTTAKNILTEEELELHVDEPMLTRHKTISNKENELVHGLSNGKQDHLIRFIEDESCFSSNDDINADSGDTSLDQSIPLQQTSLKRKIASTPYTKNAKRSRPNEMSQTFDEIFLKYKGNQDSPKVNNVNISDTQSQEESLFSPTLFDEAKLIQFKLFSTIQKLKFDFFAKLSKRRRDLFYVLKQTTKPDYEISGLIANNIREYERFDHFYREKTVERLEKMLSELDEYIKVEEECDLVFREILNKVCKKYGKALHHISSEVLNKQAANLISSLRNTLTKIASKFQNTGSF